MDILGWIDTILEWMFPHLKWMGVDWSQGFLEPPAEIGGIAHNLTSTLASLFRPEGYTHRLCAVYGKK